MEAAAVTQAYDNKLAAIWRVFVVFCIDIDHFLTVCIWVFFRSINWAHDHMQYGEIMRTD